MRLFKLEMIDEDDRDYDCAHGFVVRASSEAHAREIASGEAGNEKAEFWKDPDKSRCEVLRVDGDPGIILRDFHAG